MEAYLNRNGTGKYFTDVTTIGDFVVNGVDCLILEDDYDEEKEYAHTRIPSGRYELKLRTFGGHNEKYSKRFPDMHIGMIQLMDVPNYTDILIHCGNTAGDTAGCLLTWTEKANYDRVIGSEKAYKKIYPIISVALAKGEKCYLNIID